MDSTLQMQHPLAIHLQRQTQHLASIIPPGSPSIAQLQNASDTQTFLNTLSTLLSNPAYTQIVATLFRPILLDLCARWLDDDKNAEKNLCALAFLVEIHEELFPILSRLLRKHFPRGPLASAVDSPRLSAILLAYYRILRANRQLPSQRNWSPTLLSSLMWNSELARGLRMLAAKCYAIQVGMGDLESTTLELEVAGGNEDAECYLEYGNEVDGSLKLKDGWILENVEIERVTESRNKMVTEPIEFFHSERTLRDEDLSPALANIEGVLLLKSLPIRPNPTNYIPTPSGNEALRSLAHHVSLRAPTLFTSPPSAGKALLLNHLAVQLYPNVKNQIITIHLADTSLDPRSLLGSYISSTTKPGTFEWKEGVLVRAMREGKWTVLEDVDRGSNEVLGTLKPLVESMGASKWIGGNASIYVPGRGDVAAHEDFMLFATRSLNPSMTGRFPSPTFFGAHKYMETTLLPPTTDELRTITEAQFPRLAGPLASATINLWTSAKDVPKASSSRIIGLRELTKFSQRLEALLPSSIQSMDVDSDSGSTQATLAELITNPSLREDIFLEARDVFFGVGTTTAAARAATDNIASVVAGHLGLDEERCRWLINKRTPDFHVQKDTNGHPTGLRVGRTYLPARSTKSELSQSQSRPFALHRPAVCLLSRAATAISLNEPVLLTGETGTGKTSAITHLAATLRRPLISLNLSHQTESSDLIGGLRPVDAHGPGFGLFDEFLELFGATFSRKKNEKFVTEVRKAVNEAKWKRAIGLWKESVRMAQERYKAQKESLTNLDREQEAALPRKRRKLDLQDRWSKFLSDVEQFEVQHVHGGGKFAFGFVEGPLVKALRNGDWILLDEINLASPETLECITSLLHGPTASITLTENGELEPIPRHPDFRLFACMNPATDVGKKDLAPNIRSRFTEIDVPPPDADKDTLLSIIEQYIGGHAIGDKGAIMNVAEFYMAVKDLVEKRQLADGSNHRPHFSMRSLSRALTFAADIAHVYTLRRAIWEGCLMAFTMVLDEQSAQYVTALAQKHLLVGVRNPRSMLSREPNPPKDIERFSKFGPFYLEKGPIPEDPVEDYIMTPSVERKLVDLARIILTRRFPVLIEGPTSSGKTSSIEYLAKRTGHQFIRINNHEHTDIQEYIGSYVSDPLTGKLVFKDGLLVQALRTGSWIVLDELNLAPTDVLEALNRLLDDNRELVIPETGEVVRPHPSFMLFATQNPPGLYGGRKVLSRAFRNRFLEVHFDDVPQDELETILCQRCRIAPSYGKKIVMVFRELQKRRDSTKVFESKQGFATLRDLFRWAGRDAVGYQELAENGYMLLAERARREEDKVAVKSVIESVMGVRIDETSLYNLSRADFDPQSYLGCPHPQTSSVIWTKAMQRLFMLVSRALKYNEPVLLVGETGSGKTSVCQVFADTVQQTLRGLNCHQNTETADIIGGLRPLRNRAALQGEAILQATRLLEDAGLCDSSIDPTSVPALVELALKATPPVDPQVQSQLVALRGQLLQSQAIFEWHDGPLISAMRDGDVFLLDEISLAEDSVLERLNSVLEPARSIVLAEQGGRNLEKRIVQADPTFKLIATMNPGGDYGKKELSPALRNRFTEIWVPRVEDRADLELIIDNLWKKDELRCFTPHILDFVEWICSRVGDKSLLGLRDILAWVSFTNGALDKFQGDADRAAHVFHHAAHMAYLDGLGSLPQLSGYSREALKRIHDEATKKLSQLVPVPAAGYDSTSMAEDSPTEVQLGLFAIKAGELEIKPQLFTLSAPTTQSNAMRIARACQVAKPVLLEGSPGVGKTSLVTALANLTGHELHRINLSDQTDLVDLFGSDLPVEGGRPGEFAWRDGEFLQALQLGHWVLLDEMNLAPQAVLEGLNAVLDHRGSVYIPELGRTFECHPSFRIFAAQNPLNQGGGRKGLPKSFVNRFTKVYVEDLTPEDYLLVCRHLFPDLSDDVLRHMITFNSQLNEQVVVRKVFGREGAPWEFNLRDIIRWGTLCQSQADASPASYLHTIYLNRFRTIKDRHRASELFKEIFHVPIAVESSPPFTISPGRLEVGHFACDRRNFLPTKRAGRLLQSQLFAHEALGHCASKSWLTIVVGPRNSGKSELVRTFATLTGNRLQEIPVNNATDTTDILGSFEQLDVRGRLEKVLDGVLDKIDRELRLSSGSKSWINLQEQESQLRAIRVDLEADINHHLQLSRLILSQLAQSPLASDYSADLEDLISIIDNKDALGSFEWVDGPLVRAMKLGQWVVLDGANLCNPSVLDRLNSLCESDGTLVLSERGFLHGRVQIIKPHQDFRLFMLVDPQHGELSRAMRNRGIEVSLVGQPPLNDTITMRDHLRLPTQASLEVSAPSYDAIRRATSAHTVPVGNDRPGLGLVQRPSKSFILSGQASILQLASNHPWNFAVPFVFRVLVPATTRNLDRLLASFECSPALLEFVQRAANVVHEGHVQSFRAHLSRQVGSGDSLSYKAMDWFLATSPTDGGSEISPEHRALYGYLELLSLSYLLHHGGVTTATIQGDKFAQANRSLPDGIQRIIDALQRCVSGLLTETALEPNMFATVSNLGASLLRQATELQQTLVEPTFDFSRAYSSIICIVEIMKDAPQSFSEVSACVEQVHRELTLKTGTGLIAIWRTFYSTIPDDAQLKAQHYAQLSCRADVAISANIRRQIFDVLALTTLPSQTTDTSSLWDSLDKCIPEIEDDEPVTYMEAIDPQTLVLELAALSALTADGAKASRNLQTVVRNHLVNSQTSVMRLLPYQHLIWSFEAASKSPQHWTRALFSWLDGLWQARSPCINAEGPALLYSSVHLIQSLTTCDNHAVPLSELEAYKTEIHSRIDAALLQCQEERLPSEMLEMMMAQNIYLVACCFTETFTQGQLDKILELSTRPGCLLTQVDALRETTHAELKQLVETTLRPCFDASLNELMPHQWLALGRMLFQLLVPNIPIDPATVQNATALRLKQEQSYLEAQILLHAELESSTTGNRSNQLIDYLQTQLESTRAQASQWPAAPGARDVNRLHQFWAEVGQFATSVLHPSKTNALCELVKTNPTLAALQEQVIQESLSGFQHRLDTMYHDFSDITNPIKLAIVQCRLGLRLLVAAPQVQSDAVVPPLVAFPSMSGITQIVHRAQTAGASSTSDVATAILLPLAAITREVNAGQDLSTRVQFIEMLYEQAFGIWSIDQARTREAEERMSILYRGAAIEHNAMTDAELEAQEFLELFPAFEDALEPSDSSAKATSTTSLVQPTHMASLAAIHLSFFDHQGSSASLYWDMKKSALLRLLTSDPAVFTSEMDRASRSFQLALLDDHSTSLLTTPATGKLPNFYLDSNVAEVSKLLPVVTKMRDRVQALLTEWPDQEVLRHLIDCCNKVMVVDLHSPVAKALEATEQLLLQSEDWEIYANRENTLKAHREELVNLIVLWRRLELSSWQTLLQNEADKMEAAAGAWWFRLYDAAVRGVMKAVDEVEAGDSRSLDAYLEELIPLTKEFISTSPLGEYRFRMRLLSAFFHYLSFLSEQHDGQRKHVLTRVSRILRSLHRYFDTFSPKLDSHLSTQRAKLEKDIKNFIKLASWKDINILALKQSAKKSHHQLYKVIRKFRDVLKQPVTTWIIPQFLGDRPVTPTDNPTFSLTVTNLTLPLDIHTSTSEHIRNLGRTCRRFEALINTTARPFVQASCFQLPDELACEIIATSRRLAALSCPSDLEKEKRVKFVKSIQTQKRKAWSDLLKELKKVGFSYNLKVDVVRDNSDDVRVHDRLPLCVDGANSAVSQKAESYFNAVQACLPTLRASLSGHHSDLPTRDVSRGIAFVEGIFHAAMDIRTRASASTALLATLRRIFARLQEFAASSLHFYDSSMPLHTRSVLTITCRIVDALRELKSTTSVFFGRVQEGVIPTDALTLQDQLISRGEGLQAAVTGVMKSVEASPLLCLTEREREVLRDAMDYINEVPKAISTLKTSFPQLNFAVIPFQSWLSAEIRTISLLAEFNDATATDSEPTGFTSLLDALLLSVQSIVALKAQAEGLEDDEDKQIAVALDQLRRIIHPEKADQLQAQLLDTLSQVKSQVAFNNIVVRLLPFLEFYMTLLEDQNTIILLWAKGLFKLDYVLCSLVQTLCSQGFCAPPDGDEEAGDGAAGESTAEGVGMGEGSGKDNVSKEIEDESQVEGLQGEEEGKNEAGEEDEEGAVEMSEDFGGELQDVPDKGEDENEDDDSDTSSNADLDEQIQDLDASDPAALDEKLWGDESGPEDKDSNDKTDQDHSKESEGKSEMTAKEKEGKDAKQKKDESKSDAPNETPEDEIVDQDEDVPMEEPEGEGDETDPAASGAPMEEHIPDANTLDLPEDLDLGEEGGSDDLDMKDDLEDDDDAMEEDIDRQDLDGEVPKEERIDENGDKDDSSMDNADNAQIDEVMDDSETKADDAAQAVEEGEEGQDEEEDTEKPTATADDPSAGPADSEEPTGEISGDASADGQAGTSRSAAGQESMSAEQQMEKDGSTHAEQQSFDAPPEASDTAGATTSGKQEGTMQSESEFKDLPNPMRSLGDAMKEIQHRFEEILNVEDEQQAKAEAMPADNNPSQLEYLHPDVEDDQSMQALAAADDQKIAKLDDLQFAEDVDTTTEDHAMDIDTPAPNEPRPETSSLDNMATEADATSQGQKSDIEGAVIQRGLPSEASLPNAVDPTAPKAEEDLADLDEQAEAELRSWRDAGQPEDRIENIWRLYESLTHDLAYALCEQLRLILEPTMATRLKGDYRTGKRLNMKKVIPYIASDYTKDKIWLRRTKPSQREYQVLIAIDDSRSMAESHSIHLAYESLALIGKALGRLESGDVAIAKFGEGVDLLHDFDAGPFTDQAGAKVVSAFHFNQKATNVLSLLETSLRVLESARERRSMGSSSAADLWQLEIIISDGMCQDHEKLRTMLRRAEEKRIMVVFIILDSLHTATPAGTATSDSKAASERSILNMDRAEFKNVDGRMELQLQKYLDSFPFEYYVVLRDVEALPDVLSSTLKQFFERIAED